MTGPGRAMAVGVGGSEIAVGVGGRLMAVGVAGRTIAVGVGGSSLELHARRAITAIASVKTAVLGFGRVSDMGKFPGLRRGRRLLSLLRTGWNGAV